MTEPNATPFDAQVHRRLDEPDHDLLTFGEAGARLWTEIAAVTVDLENADARKDATGAASARARRDLLRQAAERNSAQPINDANFETFFGYPGKARHTTTESSGPPPLS